MGTRQAATLLVWGFAVLAASGCKDEPPMGLSGLGGGGQVADAGGSGGEGGRALVPQAGDLDWTAPSAALGCGEACDTLGVGSQGGCSESGVAVYCQDGLIRCDQCDVAGQTCQSDGGPARCRRPCEGESVCPATGACFELKCCPNTRWCNGNAQAICNENGTDMVMQPCLKGLDCISGQCVPARPMLHVIFDTSGSMNSQVRFGRSESAWPMCEDPAAPTTLIGISKRAFHDLFGDPNMDSVLFSLQRFPQRLDPALKPYCPSAAYVSQERITDHQGKWQVADDATGEWFERHLGEVLLVPFPRARGGNNREALLSWLDSDEVLEETEEPCERHSDCGATGMCTHLSKCRYLREPEVRAVENALTPLGTSLFYAAEYLRRRVVVDGAPCKIAADCLSAPYLCVGGVCRDPNRFCRQRAILVFTDGFDTASASSWTDPVVQAKRLRGGLDCESDAVCGAGWTCVSGACQPAGAGANPCAGIGANCGVEARPFPEAVTRGVDRLRDRNGDPITVTVHVVDVSGLPGYVSGGASCTSTPGAACVSDAQCPCGQLCLCADNFCRQGACDFLPNPAIAAYGGGLLVLGDTTSSAALLTSIRGVLDWKDANFCPDPR